MVQPVFDRPRVRRNLDRAGQIAGGADVILRETSAHLLERLDEIRQGHRRVLALGTRHASLIDDLRRITPDSEIVATALVPRLLPAPSVNIQPLLADEEVLPFADASFDLVVSASALHAVNDLPGTLMQIRCALRPNGLFLASLPAGNTLHELRETLLEAENVVSGGAGLRVALFSDVRTLGNLLVRAGFALPVADTDTMRLAFPNLLALIRALRAAGEGNALTEGTRHSLPRAILIEASNRYVERYGDGKGGILATFETVTLTGWAPGPGQPRALVPGSATASLSEALRKGSSNNS